MTQKQSIRFNSYREAEEFFQRNGFTVEDSCIYPFQIQASKELRSIYPTFKDRIEENGQITEIENPYSLGFIDRSGTFAPTNYRDEQTIVLFYLNNIEENFSIENREFIASFP